jgi:hypothetical protein
MREHGLRLEEIQPKVKTNVSNLILTLISKQTAADVDSGLKEFFSNDAVVVHGLAARVPHLAVEINYIVCLVITLSCSIAYGGWDSTGIFNQFNFPLILALLFRIVY